ncbi:mask, partial [Symbiodinium sp. CCMP2456]
MADTEKRSHAGETALSAALLWEHWEVARLLMDAGAAKEQALCLACARGQAAAVQFLLDAETDIEEGNSMGETPLFLALLHGHWEVTRLLTDAGGVKERALWLAAARGHGNVVRQLLNAGVDIDKPNSDGEAPLFLALLHDHWEVACLLMDRGADKEGRPAFEAKVPLEDAGLTATGRWQAEQLRLRLVAAQQEGSLPQVIRVACSPLRRARETATTLFPKHEVQILDDLAERRGPRGQLLGECNNAAVFGYQ